MADDPDFRFYASFRDNPKRLELQDTLGADGALAVVDLWCWARANRPTGDLTGISTAAIEKVAGWPGKRGVLVAFLAAKGWLDGSEGAYRLHGWGDRQGWASGSPARSQAGKVAAIVKQCRKLGITPDQYLDDAGGEDMKNDRLRERAKEAYAKRDKTKRTTTVETTAPTTVARPHNERPPLVSPPSPSPTPTPSPNGGGRVGDSAPDRSATGSVAAPPVPDRPAAPPRCPRCRDVGRIGNPALLADLGHGRPIRPRAGAPRPFMVPCPQCQPKAPEGAEEPAERGYAPTAKAVGISAPRPALRAVCRPGVGNRFAGPDPGAARGGPKC